MTMANDTHVPLTQEEAAAAVAEQWGMSLCPVMSHASGATSAHQHRGHTKAWSLLAFANGLV